MMASYLQDYKNPLGIAAHLSECSFVDTQLYKPRQNFDSPLASMPVELNESLV